MLFDCSKQLQETDLYNIARGQEGLEFGGGGGGEMNLYYTKMGLKWTMCQRFFTY